MALAAAAAVVAVALYFALGGGGERQPSDAAARLVPAGALAYVHVSTDEGRDGVRRALALVRRFPAWPGVRAAVLRRITAAGCGVTARDVRGKEAAVAILGAAGAGASPSLVLLGGASHPVPTRRCGRLEVRRIGGFLALGTPSAIAAATAAQRGRARSLADTRDFRRATSGLPAGRVLDGYVSAAGLRTLLAPQGGLVGAAGVLLDRPGLRAVGFGLEAQDHGARIVARVLGARGGRGPFRSFEPSLDRAVPAGVLGYVGLRGLGPAVQRLVGAAGSGGTVGGLLGRIRRELARTPGLERRLAALFGGETAAWITPSLPAPVLTLLTKTGDEAAARTTLAELQAPLSAAFTPGGTGGGQAPTFGQRRVAGTTAFQLRLAQGVELDYAVFDGRVVVSTALSGIVAARTGGRPLPDTRAWRSVLGDAPSEVTSLAFLDFSELLRLGEQTGLDSDRAFRKVRDDLTRVRAVGVASTGSKDTTTAQVELSIP